MRRRLMLSTSPSLEAAEVKTYVCSLSSSPIDNFQAPTWLTDGGLAGSRLVDLRVRGRGWWNWGTKRVASRVVGCRTSAP